MTDDSAEEEGRDARRGAVGGAVADRLDEMEPELEADADLEGVDGSDLQPRPGEEPLGPMVPRGQVVGTVFAGVAFVGLLVSGPYTVSPPLLAAGVPLGPAFFYVRNRVLIEEYGDITTVLVAGVLLLATALQVLIPALLVAIGAAVGTVGYAGVERLVDEPPL